MNIFLFLLLFTANKSQAEILFFSSFFIYFIAPACLQKNSSFMATGKGFMGEIEKIIIIKKTSTNITWEDKRKT